MLAVTYYGAGCNQAEFSQGSLNAQVGDQWWHSGNYGMKSAADAHFVQLVVVLVAKAIGWCRG